MVVSGMLWSGGVEPKMSSRESVLLGGWAGGMSDESILEVLKFYSVGRCVVVMR